MHAIDPRRSSPTDPRHAPLLRELAATRAVLDELERSLDDPPLRAAMAAQLEEALVRVVAQLAARAKAAGERAV